MPKQFASLLGKRETLSPALEVIEGLGFTGRRQRCVPPFEPPGCRSRRKEAQIYSARISALLARKDACAARQRRGVRQPSGALAALRRPSLATADTRQGHALRKSGRGLPHSKTSRTSRGAFDLAPASAQVQPAKRKDAEAQSRREIKFPSPNHQLHLCGSAALRLGVKIPRARFNAANAVCQTPTFGTGAE